MAKRRLPIGIQTFRKVREDNCYYVDKTSFIERLIAEGTHYFLSRPRRFGKSLFLDTLKELFEGNEALFKGLHVHRSHDWSQCHPVVRLSFGGGSFKDPEVLTEDVALQLEELEAAADIKPRAARGQVPGPGRADSPDRRGVEPQDAHRDRLRGGRRLTVVDPGGGRIPCVEDAPGKPQAEACRRRLT